MRRRSRGLSRSKSRPSPTHNDHYRLSLLTGETAYDPGEFSQATIEIEVSDLIGIEDAQTAHERWLASDVAAAFNESVYHPYTSLKFHTLLVAALLDNPGPITTSAISGSSWTRRATSSRSARSSTATASRSVSTRTPTGVRRPGFGSRPWRSWASVWNRLTAHPLDTGHDKYDMTLDANLRRMQSWSAALQYIEDYHEWRPDR